MPGEQYRPQEWFRVQGYQLIVHAAHEEHVSAAPGALGRPGEALPLNHVAPGAPPHQRLVYLEVEYANATLDQSLSCRRNQWFLYDTAGYSYEAEPANEQLYRARGRPFLGGDRLLAPGGKLRGWVAFRVPAGAVVERAQFLTGFLVSFAADIMLRAADPGATVPLKLPAALATPPPAPHIPAELVEQELIGLLYARADALVRRDLAFLDALLDPEFRYVNAHGNRLERAAYLAQLAAGRLQFRAQVIEEVDVQLLGDVALVTCVLADEASFDGEPFAARFRAVQLYRRAPTGWRMLFGQTTQTL